MELIHVLHRRQFYGQADFMAEDTKVTNVQSPVQIVDLISTDMTGMQDCNRWWGVFLIWWSCLIQSVLSGSKDAPFDIQKPACYELLQ